MDSKVYSVIVTYGKRAHLLKQVIDACFKEGVYKIILVDNASEDKEKIEKEILDKYKGKIIYYRFEKNTGSAGGFKKGLEIAMKQEDCDFIWLLDDDNVPQKDSLKELLKKYYLEKKKGNNKIILHSVREVGKILSLGINKNSYQGISISGFIKAILKTFLGIKNTKSENKVCAYGGMFFNKKIIINEQILPNEKYFVYLDDMDFSYRFYLKGYRIIHVNNSIIKDIDFTSLRTYNIFLRRYLFLKDSSDIKVYYSVRNIIIFEQIYKNTLRDNIIEYTINKIIAKTLYKIFILLIKYKDKKPERANLIEKAIHDGENMIW